MALLALNLKGNEKEKKKKMKQQQNVAGIFLKRNHKGKYENEKKSQRMKTNVKRASGCKWRPASNSVNLANISSEYLINSFDQF